MDIATHSFLRVKIRLPVSPEVKISYILAECEPSPMFLSRAVYVLEPLHLGVLFTWVLTSPCLEPKTRSYPILGRLSPSDLISFLAFKSFFELVSPKGWSMSCVSSNAAAAKAQRSGAVA